MEDRINFGVDLINGCLLPELIHEIGSEFIESKHFDDYRKNLNQQLIVLFDYIQKNEHLLYDKDNNPLELKTKFFLLLFEQTSSNTLFQTHDNNLLNNLHCLIEKHSKLLEDNVLEQKLLTHYKTCLKSTNWKKNLGSAHGFERFCEIFFKTGNHYLDTDGATFVLSVGLLFEEFFELEYKEKAFRLFNIILERTSREIICDLNIHNLIYDTGFKNISKITTEKGTNELWRCLCDCIKLFNITNFSKWNKIDDIISALIHRITFESNPKVATILIILISKVFLISVPSSIYIDETITSDNLKMDNQIKYLKDNIHKTNILASYRWVKKLLQLFIAESNGLLGDGEIAITLLNAMHITYLICIYSIPLQILEIHLFTFLEKFSIVLIEILRINKNNQEIKLAVGRFYETFLKQIQIAENKNDKIKNYEIAFEKILKNELLI